ncbi:uncharacterized protein LOC111404514 [Olea europaea var. sylvestris]|uniref:uncharacterized protein LOC111404514 n=1 Tax=Olea europaea var. sylvestris TaxID=158386 RepID=UPI000C1CE5C3|nr:uncharacterized protein LOC111404514 [Olea europaea var. sylvestris]
MEATMETAQPPTWKLFIDESSGEAGSGAGIVLEIPEGHKLNCAVRFGFKISNNGTEYEALLAGLKLARKMQVRRLLASNDSQLVVSRVNGNFEAKDSSMVVYLKLVLDLVLHFEKFELIQVPCLENTQADALSKLASSKDSELLKPIIAYLKDQSLPASRSEARKLRRRDVHFVLQEDILYKRSFAPPLLRCVGGEEAIYILREIHEGICGNHSGGTALAHKSLSVVISPWPFAEWGIDFIGPLPKGRGSVIFAIAAINYFTKWVEAEPLAKITEANTTKFIWKNIICRFSILHSLVSDNGRQFDNRKMRNLCDELGIKKDFSTLNIHKQMGKKLDISKGTWVDELPHALWAIRTTSLTTTGETPFCMTCGAEAMTPVELFVTLVSKLLPPFFNMLIDPIFCY